MATPRSSVRASAVTSLVCLCLGLLVIAAGLVVPAVVRRKLHDGILDTIIWRPDSPALTQERFRNTQSGPDTPRDLFSVFLFNITNLEDVQLGALPQLEQVGPYVHRVAHEKHDALWDDAGRVRFKDYTHYTLDTSLTAPHLLSANVTTFNLALLGVLANLHGSVAPQYQPFTDVLMQAINSYITSDAGLSGVFTTRPALELLWGYEDPLLRILNTLAPGTLADGATVRLLKNTSSLAEALARAPNVFNTGRYDPAHIWDAEADQGRRAVTTWPCQPEAVHGSDASQFPPGLTAASAVEVFIADLFQARRLVVNSTVDLHGVRLLRFWLDPAQNLPNPCRNQELRGLMNITTPQAAGFNGSMAVRGPYVFVSMPMFCGADDRLAAEAGLVCDEAQHQTWVDVEPITGITMRVYKRLMMSSRVGDLAFVLDPAVRRNLTIPMFWAEEVVAVTPALAAQFKSQVYRAQWVAAKLGKLCWLVGGALLLVGVLLAAVAVEATSDPGTWPGRSLFGRASAAAGAAGEGGAGDAEAGTAAAAAGGVGAPQGNLRQPLLQGARGAAGARGGSSEIQTSS